MTQHIELNKKPRVNVGTIGHIDHGKSSSSNAVCGVLNSKQILKMIRELDLIDKDEGFLD
jgi:translation elongation factor EF-Tu-like GTPase